MRTPSSRDSSPLTRWRSALVERRDSKEAKDLRGTKGLRGLLKGTKLASTLSRRSVLATNPSRRLHNSRSPVHPRIVGREASNAKSELAANNPSHRDNNRSRELRAVSSAKSELVANSPSHPLGTNHSRDSSRIKELRAASSVKSELVANNPSRRPGTNRSRELRAAKEELREASNAKSELVANSPSRRDSNHSRELRVVRTENSALVVNNPSHRDNSPIRARANRDSSARSELPTNNLSRPLGSSRNPDHPRIVGRMVKTVSNDPLPNKVNREPRQINKDNRDKDRVSSERSVD
jgi:hypothetical protein